MATSKSKAIDIADIVALLMQNEELLNDLFKNEKVKEIIKKILAEIAAEQVAGKKPWWKKALSLLTAIFPYLLNLIKRK